jgi:hypothetical protein
MASRCLLACSLAGSFLVWVVVCTKENKEDQGDAAATNQEGKESEEKPASFPQALYYLYQ